MYISGPREKFWEFIDGPQDLDPVSSGSSISHLPVAIQLLSEFGDQPPTTRSSIWCIQLPLQASTARIAPNLF